MAYVSSKTYGAERGFSVAYRQWRADSHCSKIHGYALGFHFEFESVDLDARNWVVDFGSLRTFKEFLDDNFDHTFIVSEDDPALETFKGLHTLGLCKMVVVEKTGCEGLSKFLHDYLNEIWLPENGYGGRVRCRLVRVTETPSNSAQYES